MYVDFRIEPEANSSEKKRSLAFGTGRAASGYRSPPQFTDVYFDMSQGDGDASGPWNSGENWQVVSDREAQAAVDGGDGLATVKMPAKDAEVVAKMAERTASDPTIDPITGADLGAGPGAGSTTPVSE